MIPIPDAGAKAPTSIQSHARAAAAVLGEEFGVPFDVYDAESGRAVRAFAPSSGPSGTEPTEQSVRAVAALGRCRTSPVGDGCYELFCVIHAGPRPTLVARGVVPGLAPAGAPSAREHERLGRWLQAVADRNRLGEQLAVQRHAAEDRGKQAARAWGVVLEVDDAVRRLRVHRDRDRSRRGLLKVVQATTGAEQAAWIPLGHSTPPLLHGEPVLAPTDCAELFALLARTEDRSKAAAPIIRNSNRGEPWSARFPHVRGILAVPVADGAQTGWIAAINKVAPRTAGDGDGTERALPFRRADATALLPFAALFELQLRGGRRFREMKDLLVGLTRSLTAAIDAKDSYTFGHSERVARVAVELARELGLSPEESSDIYLAGLLHDIGKIGIRDSVLLKSGPLSTEEFDHIKLHPAIGFQILSELRPLASLLPGVRNHHERFDGKGYPDGLAGEAIPLLARILAVADAFDAMNTERPYRPSLTPEEVEARLRDGSGTQWDPRVIGAFFARRAQVNAVRQCGVGLSLRRAIDGALRGNGSSYRPGSGEVSLRTPALPPDPAPAGGAS